MALMAISIVCWRIFLLNDHSVQELVTPVCAIYVNDIVQLFDGLYVCKLYADDLNLYSIPESSTDPKTMQDALNKLLK